MLSGGWRLLPPVSQMGEQRRSPRKVKVMRRGPPVSPEQPPLQQHSERWGKGGALGSGPLALSSSAPSPINPRLLPSESESQKASGPTALQGHTSRSQAPSPALLWSTSSRSSRIPPPPHPLLGVEGSPRRSQLKSGGKSNAV